MIKFSSFQKVCNVFLRCILLFVIQSCSNDLLDPVDIFPKKISGFKEPSSYELLPLLQHPEGSNSAIFVTEGLDSLMRFDFERGSAGFEHSIEVWFDYWGGVDDRLVLQESLDSFLVYHRSGQLDFSYFEQCTIPDVIELDGVKYLASFNKRIQEIRGVDSTYLLVPLSSTVYSYWEPEFFNSPCLALLDWETSELKPLDVSYPQVYKEQSNGGFLTTFPVVNRSTIVVAYPASTELCVYDLNTQVGQFVDVPPASFDFIVNPYDTAFKNDMNFVINYMLTETQVVSLDYHPELQCYIRIINHHEAGESGLNELRRTSYLQLISNEFELIGEYRLPEGVIPVHHHLCQNGFRMSYPDSLSRANNQPRYAEFDLRPLLP